VEVLIVLIAVPAFGALLLLAEWQARDGMERRTRAQWRRSLWGFGAVAFPLAVFLLVDSIRRLVPVLGSWSGFDWPHLALLLARLLLIGVICVSGLRAFAVARIEDTPPANVIEAARRNRESEQLRLAAWILVAFPLLWLISLALMVAAPLLYLLAIWSTAGRAQRGQLLWLMRICVESGLSLDDEIDAYAETLWWPARNRVRALGNRLHDGASLADALEVDGSLLSAANVMAIRVGEETGTLEAVLQEQSNRYLREMQRVQLDGSVAAIAAYYWLVVVVFLVALGFLCFRGVPQLKSIFDSFGVEPPGITLWFFSLADRIVESFWLLLPLVGIPMTLLFLLTYAYLVGWDHLKLPLLMRWFPRRDAPGILRSLATATATSSPLPNLVAQMAEHHPRYDLGQRLYRVSEALAAGDDSWSCLRQEGLLTGREAAAVAAAARGSSLPFALTTLADSIDRGRQHRMLWLIEIGQPFVIVCIGLIIGAYCLAFFLPLVAIIQNAA